MLSSTSLNFELRVFKSLTGDFPLEALTRKKLPQNDGGGVGVVKRHIGVPKEIDQPYRFVTALKHVLKAPVPEKQYVDLHEVIAVGKYKGHS